MKWSLLADDGVAENITLINWDNGLTAGLLGFGALIVASWFKWVYIPDRDAKRATEKAKAAAEIELARQRFESEKKLAEERNTCEEEYQKHIVRIAEDNGKRQAEIAAAMQTVADGTKAITESTVVMRSSLEELHRRVDSACRHPK